MFSPYTYRYAADCPTCMHGDGQLLCECDNARFPVLLQDTRTYRKTLSNAFAAGACAPEWDISHSLARRLIKKYGPVTFARIDTIAYRYC